MSGKMQASEMHDVVRPVWSKAVSSTKLAVAVAMGLAFTYGASVHAQDATSASGIGSASAQTGQANTNSGTADAKKKREEAKQLAGVTVTGIRASVEKAQDIKRDADTFVDSLSATDIGALPDRSVTETLSRIPGVTIDHFLSQGDPEH
jgi:iron complex outermembrane recepter protein